MARLKEVCERFQSEKIAFRDTGVWGQWSKPKGTALIKLRAAQTGESWRLKYSDGEPHLLIDAVKDAEFKKEGWKEVTNQPKRIGHFGEELTYWKSPDDWCWLSEVLE